MRNSLPSPDLLRVADELEESLWRDLIAPWFPRCVDEAGGFFQNFDFEWKQTPQSPRSVVFQSRMTWVSAVLSELDHPRADEFRRFTRHGIEALRSFVGDDGAVKWNLSAEQEALGEINCYGSAFAIYALAAAFRATNDPQALTMAQSVFGWLEEVAHDDAFRGYFETIGSDGTPVLVSSSGPERLVVHPKGVKSQNTLLHLMEAFTELYMVWPDAQVRTRLIELLDIFRTKLFHESGWLSAYVSCEWDAIDAPRSIGHDIEAAHLMLAAARAISSSEFTATIPFATALVDSTLKWGVDPVDGGFFYTGEPEGVPVNTAKSWWVAPEALLGIASVLECCPDRLDLWRAFERTWRFTLGYHIDHKHGGWFETAGKPALPKGHAWKAAYHETRGLLYSARILRQLA